MANANSGTGNSNKLKSTLSELESALADWDKIPADGPKDLDDTAPDAVIQRRASQKPDIPDEMKRRTKELLDQLKQQIDEL